MEYAKKFFDFFFNQIGEDKDREGLKDTQKRVIKSWEEIYVGYNKNPKEVLSSTFLSGDCDEMVVLKNIEFYSMCEHHLLPFFGNISLGYIPKDHIVGLDAIINFIEIYTKRLQIQERLTTQIAKKFMEIVEPKGVMVVCEARHLCMAMRGTKNKNAIVNTSALYGLFKKDSKTRVEFMQLLKS